MSDDQAAKALAFCRVGVLCGTQGQHTSMFASSSSHKRPSAASDMPKKGPAGQLWVLAEQLLEGPHHTLLWELSSSLPSTSALGWLDPSMGSRLSQVTA